MSDRDDERSPDRLAREAREWIGLIASGEATGEDAAAMMRWRARSPDHARAVDDAIRLRRRLQVAGQALRQRPSTRWLVSDPSRRPGALVDRRALLGGAVAASAVGLLAARPPMGLWPSLAELRADYRTGTGEQHSMTLGQGVSVQLNTRTSVAVRPDDGAYRLRLIAGEVAVTVHGATRPAAISTDAGQALSRAGQFGVRMERSGTCVTCFEGEVAVRDRQDRRVALQAGQQTWIGGEMAPGVIPVNVQQAGAWRRGELIFTNEPLSHVVEEINRYRPGKIILANAELGHIPVNAVFRIQQMGNALSQIREVSNASATEIPGGIVLLS